MTLLRGIADDIELIEWLQKYIFPTEVRFVDAEFVRIGTELACCGDDPRRHHDLRRHVLLSGCRGRGGRILRPARPRRARASSTRRAPDAADGADSLAKAVDFARRWKGRNNRIIPIVGAHSVYTIKPDLLKRIRARAPTSWASRSAFTFGVALRDRVRRRRTTTRRPCTSSTISASSTGPRSPRTSCGRQDDEIPVLAQRRGRRRSTIRPRT